MSSGALSEIFRALDDADARYLVVGGENAFLPEFVQDPRETKTPLEHPTFGHAVLSW